MRDTRADFGRDFAYSECIDQTRRAAEAEVKMSRSESEKHWSSQAPIDDISGGTVDTADNVVWWKNLAKTLADVNWELHEYWRPPR